MKKTSDLTSISAQMQKLHLAEEELKAQQAIVEKVKKVMNLVSAFEESAAECMSNVLINFSNSQVQQGVLQTAKFICHIEMIFQILDDVEEQLLKHGDSLNLDFGREPKQLVRRIVHFCSLLSKSQNDEGREENTQELITLVTYLARLLKTLLRYSLNGVLRLVRFLYYNIARL